MIGAAKQLAKRHWPALRLRTILLGALLFVAALPAASAVFLRVYENTLVRQTEGELIAQGAALAAAAQALWPGAPAPAPLDVQARRNPAYYRPEPPTLDLSQTGELPERPPAIRAAGPPDPDALTAAARLGPILETTSRTTLASIVMTDGAGRVVRGADFGGGYGGLQEVRAALAGRSQTVLRRNGAYHPRYSFEWLSRASALRIHHARPIVVNGRVVGVLLLSRSPRALFKGLYQDRHKFEIGFGAILLLLLVLSGLLSRGITRPIEALSAASREVAAGGQGAIPETPPTAAVEIRALYEDFRAMAQAIARRSRYLRDFAAAVSHEFKTPLAGIAGAVEILQDHHGEMTEAERRRFLANISADSRRLSQLVSRLMDLARADMALPESGVSAAVEDCVRRSADAAGGSGLAIEVALPTDLPRVAVPDTTLETVLSTLVENSRQAGASSVSIGGAVHGEVVVLTVTDDGAGVPEADRVRLFEPFFTSRRAQGGTGLGLSIARSLLAASHGSVTLRDGLAGATFEVRLPVATQPA